MTWITTDDVQRVVTPKAGKSELRFLSFANYCDLHLHKVSRKYLKQFSSYRLDTNTLQKSLFSKFKGS